jgi:archaellum component FlaF (FlaF/FlaG flagellin family)
MSAIGPTKSLSVDDARRRQTSSLFASCSRSRARRTRIVFSTALRSRNSSKSAKTTVTKLECARSKKIRKRRGVDGILLPRAAIDDAFSSNTNNNNNTHPLSPCVSELSGAKNGRDKVYHTQQQSVDGATLRYIDRSFCLLEKVLPPAGLLFLVSAFCATVFSVFFAALYVFKEVVSACRNVMNACQAVIRSADAIERACSSVTTTTANLDNTTRQIDSTVLKIDVLSESATKALADAGVIQKRVADLPKDASNTLLDAISAVSVPVNQKSVLPSKAESLVGTSPEEENANKNTNTSILGTNIDGRRIGAGWIGSDSNYRFHFSATNTFSVGEYVAVKRTNNLYTWGVVENNENVDPSCMPDDNCPVDESVDAEKTGATCDWPPKKEDAIGVDGGRKGGRDERDSFKEDELNFFERVKKFALPVGLAPGQVEKEYRVVVEVSATVYRYKIVPASELGKRY